jgi:hypothetical protein
LTRTEGAIQEKTAFSRQRLEGAISKVAEGIKKLTAIKDLVYLLTSRIEDLKDAIRRPDLDDDAPAEAAQPPDEPPQQSTDAVLSDA